jgi:hypothetical protein
VKHIRLKILSIAFGASALLSIQMYNNFGKVERNPSSIKDAFKNCFSSITSFKNKKEDIIPENVVQNEIDIDDFDDEIESFFTSHYFNVDETLPKTESNSRLLNFMKFSMNRYTDEHTEKLSEKLYQSTGQIEYYTEDADVVIVSMNRIGDSLVVEIPLIKMRGSALATNANTNRMAKVLAPIFYSMLAHLNDPAIKNTSVILKDVVNPDLAKMVSKLGFISEHFSKKLSPDEIENILGKNRVVLPKKVEEPDFNDFPDEESYMAAVEKWEDYEMEVSDIINKVNSTTVVEEGSKSLSFSMSFDLSN